MVSNSTHLGRVIKSARVDRGLTQDDLSDKAGLAYSTLAKIEQGAIKAPSFFTVMAILEALELDLDHIVNSRGEIAGKGPNLRSQTASKPIKFIYCDMNGVLVRFYHRAFVTVAEETNKNLELVETLFWHYNDIANRGSMSLDKFNKELAEKLGVAKIDWQKHYMHEVQPIVEMQEFMKRAQAKIKVGLLTNTMPGFVDDMFKRHILPDMKFDVIVDSSVVRAVKPEPNIYKIAEEKAGHKGKEILFIDDSRTNLTMAEKFGWRVVWFDDYDPEESVKRIQQILDEN
jgi:HAD superfamily hydrolase (TIGR01509 family)